LSELEVGDEVVIRATVVGAAATANLIVVPKAKPATVPSGNANG
jgi:hypothetical protein